MEIKTSFRFGFLMFNTGEQNYLKKRLKTRVWFSINEKRKRGKAEGNFGEKTSAFPCSRVATRETFQTH